MEEAKNKIEALLFASGRQMDIEEICNICKVDREKAEMALRDLKIKYESHKAITLVHDGNFWKLTVNKDYMPLVQGIVSKTELSKSLMETLAVIAFKYPIKQSDVIKIRTNKAYDHLKELGEMGYITRQKYGRTRLIKLAQKFFDYFDLPEQKLKETFKDFDTLAKAIEEKEGIIDKMKNTKKEDSKEGSKTEIIKEKEVDLVDDKGHNVKLEVVDASAVETYEDEAEKPMEVVETKEKLGDLEVVDELEQKEEPKEKKEEEFEKKEREEQIEQMPPEDMMEELEEKKVAEELNKVVDARVDELLHPEPAKKEEEEEDNSVKIPSVDSNEEAESPVEEKDLFEASREEEQKEKEEDGKKKQ